MTLAACYVGRAPADATATRDADAAAHDGASDAQAAAVDATDASGADGPAAEDVVPAATYVPVGAPTWRVRCEQSAFAAPTEPAAYRAAVQRFFGAAVRPEHNVAAIGPYAFPPGDVHGPPYDDEARRFLTRAGSPPRVVYGAGEVSSEGSHAVLCVAFGAEGSPRGVTRDGPDLPMLAASSFPLRYEAQHLYEGVRVIGATEALPFPGRAGEDGVTHVLLRYGMQLLQPLKFFPAHFEFTLALTDADGNGYRVTLPFVVYERAP